MPPLRSHREDIPDIARASLERLVEARSVPVRRFSTAALNALRQHDWPGNLHELENVVRSAALAALTEEIGLEDVVPLLASAAAAGRVLPLDLDLPLREARDAFEKLYFEHHIAKAGGNMSRVADAVGLERTHLYRKLKQLDVRVGRRNE
ncbi:helix-turn-helix domain-containing protein [Thiobacter aerophilum]|uniref:helix-turn-helix domain-containing protein n=1 Tax=Thiobacter aerophilum TaxID=3121275 RepID=UPI003D2FB8A0